MGSSRAARRSGNGVYWRVTGRVPVDWSASHSRGRFGARYTPLVRRIHESGPDGPKEPLASGPVALGDEYRRAIDRAESLAENRPGADKTWVEHSLREYRAHYARASPAR